MSLPQSNASLIDALGAVQQTIQDLRSRELTLIGRVGRLGLGSHEGNLYDAHVAAILDPRGGVHVIVTRKEGKR
jgi:hypothetical protein